MKNSSNKILSVAVVLLLITNIGLVIFLMNGKGRNDGKRTGGGKGELVMFKAKKTLVDVIGMGQWTKFVCGVEGDVISHKERAVFINNVKVGDAIVKSKLFKKDMEIIDDGVIPKGFVFVCGTHQKSFDSKYKLVGLVDEKTFVGRAIRLF